VAWRQGFGVDGFAFTELVFGGRFLTDPSMKDHELNKIVSIALDLLGKEIVDINRNNGWNVTTDSTWNGPDKNKIPAICALIHSEVSEALEAFRKDDMENFAEEMADVAIRVLDCTAGLGIDLADEILKKLEKNKSRGYRHGGKIV
jgi:NTP pyrophosphatase (non-canonical NTP hydrolase)